MLLEKKYGVELGPYFKNVNYISSFTLTFFFI